MKLSVRSTEAEIMDDSTISGEVVDQTLRELNTINTWLGGNEISVRCFQRLVKDRDEVSLVDLGCGGGDILKKMASWTRKKGINSKYVGIDANPAIIEYAEKNCKDFVEIDFLSLNIFDDAFKNMRFDVVHACLFTHHFTDDQLIDLFRLFKKQSKLAVLINDLHRHSFAYRSIALLTRLFSKSFMVRNDAKVSVERGFKRAELVKILQAAGIQQFQLKWKWAFRWQLIF